MENEKKESKYYVEPVYVERQNPQQLEFIDSLDITKISHDAYQGFKRKDTPKMSIGVLGYRHLEQTRRCVESVLRYIGTIDYELILVDNASDDGDATVQYFQSVPTIRKKVIQVREAVGTSYGSIFGTQLMYQFSSGDIFVFLGNDNIITENALQNMLACLESSTNIGLVTPMSSNAYMLQNPGLQYRNYDEMFCVAQKFNHYDPTKWEERLLIATVATAVKREAVVAAGFYDYFSAEAGLCQRIREAGYKTLLLGDTWVCHDHDYSTKKDTQAWLGEDDRSKYILEHNEKLFQSYTGGLTQFGDIMVFEKELCNLLSTELSGQDIPNLLAVDVRAGQGLFDLKNKLRTLGVLSTYSVAFSTQFKYYKFLHTTADEVLFDRIEFIGEHLEGKSFDYILIGEPINMYKEPIHLLQKILSYLSHNGQLLFKVRNTADFQTFIKIFGQSESLDPEMPIHIDFKDLVACLNLMGYQNVFLKRMLHSVSQDTVDRISRIVKGTGLTANVDECVANICTKEYFIHVINA